MRTTLRTTASVHHSSIHWLALQSVTEHQRQALVQVLEFISGQNKVTHGKGRGEADSE